MKNWLSMAFWSFDQKKKKKVGRKKKKKKKKKFYKDKSTKLKKKKRHGPINQVSEWPLQLPIVTGNISLLFDKDIPMNVTMLLQGPSHTKSAHITVHYN